MEVIVGIIFITILLVVVYGAIQPGLENLRIAEQEASKLEDIRMAGVAAQAQVDEIIARYGQMVDEILKGETAEQRDPQDVIIFSENEFNIL